MTRFEHLELSSVELSVEFAAGFWQKGIKTHYLLHSQLPVHKMRTRRWFPLLNNLGEHATQYRRVFHIHPFIHVIVKLIASVRFPPWDPPGLKMNWFVFLVWLLLSRICGILIAFLALSSRNGYSRNECVL